MSSKVKKKKEKFTRVTKKSRIGKVADVFFGLEKDFVLIFGGGFLVVTLGVMLFFR